MTKKTTSEMRIKTSSRKKTKPVNFVSNKKNIKTSTKKCSKKQQFSKPLPKSTRLLLIQFSEIIKTAMPLSAKQTKLLPKNLKDLFSDLTNDRSNRRFNYLNDASQLSAYVYHYMQWNIFKLVKIFSTLDFSSLKDGDFLADFGSGPLTVVLALWIAKPELRKKKLTWYCVDNAGKALSVGKDIFLTLCAHTMLTAKTETNPWNIIKVTGKFGIPLRNKISLYTSANLFNEFFSHSKKTVPQEANKIANIIKGYLKPNADIIVIEPGVPLGGEFISALRSEFIENNYDPISPCTHNNLCPLSITKNTHQSSFIQSFNKQEKRRNPVTVALKKWCHFNIETYDAPRHLKDFSYSVNLPKETVAVSFLYCKPKSAVNSQRNSARIISDVIKLPENKIGRYCCSEDGFLLLRSEAENPILQKSYSGDLLEFYKLEKKFDNKNFDKKSGAKIIDLN